MPEDFHSERGHMTVCQLAPGLWSGRARGCADAAMALWLLSRMDEAVLLSAHVCIFHDWEDLQRYDNEAKMLMTAWAIKHANIESHILTRSRLVSMAVSVARLATNTDIHGYEERVVWLQRLEQAQVRQAESRDEVDRR